MGQIDPIKVNCMANLNKINIPTTLMSCFRNLDTNLSMDNLAALFNNIYINNMTGQTQNQNPGKTEYYPWKQCQ